MSGIETDRGECINERMGAIRNNERIINQDGLFRWRGNNKKEWQQGITDTRKATGTTASSTNTNLMGIFLSSSARRQSTRRALVREHLQLHEEHLRLEEGRLLEDSHRLGESLNLRQREVLAALNIDLVEALGSQDAVGLLEVLVVGLTELEDLSVGELGHCSATERPIRANYICL